MSSYVLRFAEIGRAHIDLVGGKGAHLGELSRIGGILVPEGFCVTTNAFRHMMTEAPAIDEQLQQLSQCQAGDRNAISAASAKIRSSISGTVLPDDIAATITGALTELGDRTVCAVRSSATAEDLPTASFAGQHDTYLNVVGNAAAAEHVKLCWASLFTERAITYRIRNGSDHRKTHMAVVVQRMIFPEASGIMFTADPVTGNRKLVSIDASFGLGEALVSGIVNPDTWKVRGGAVVENTTATKKLAIYGSDAGGVERCAIEPEQQSEPALTDFQAVKLAQLGRRIEAHFGTPQDIEWCMSGGDFYIVQCRPITTLFPIPEAGDDENHVYLSVGHQQMMTDAMKPLGLSMWRLAANAHMTEAGGRLFVDVTRALTSPTSRASMIAFLGKGDPLIRDALQTIIDRGDFIRTLPDEGPAWAPPGGAALTPLETDPAIPAELIARSEASIARARNAIQSKTGSALLDFIAADIKELKGVQFEPRNLQVIMAGIEAAWWLSDHLRTWLGETNAADALTRSVLNNVTSEMGLSLLDVADVIRAHADVVAFLQQTNDDTFLDWIGVLAGGREARDAIQGWLDKYGMRGPGEIDITRPRWRERPLMLVPTILGNVRNFAPGAAAQRFEQGREDASKKRVELLERLRTLPDGNQKAEETERMIDRLRTFAGYREYPKYAMVSRYFVYKKALLLEAKRLVASNVICEEEDIFYLRFDELHDIVRNGRVGQQLIRERKDAFKSYEALTPSRVLTSDGEGLNGSYRRDNVPGGALVGMPVSAGTIEGRARVIVDMADAQLETGDILVTIFTDPSWTPLFVSIKGLVTEVGGLMTHGAVIAREYGVPAVVGVEHATRLIRDGQRIRVHGTEGYVELLDH